jgi:hypothetical protein
VDGVHHVPEHGIEKLARLLGISVGKELCRSLEVGEEDCDLFTFAFECGLGVEDPFCEMPGRVGVGGNNLGPFRLWLLPSGERTPGRI